jgi:hypothetical protein
VLRRPRVLLLFVLAFHDRPSLAARLNARPASLASVDRVYMSEPQ